MQSLTSRLVRWYALWLALVFTVSGTFIFLGLRQYLERTAARTQRMRAERIAGLLSNLDVRNQARLSEEIRARFAPEASDRFIRIETRDGFVLYESGVPHDRKFDPGSISRPAFESGTRKERLRDGSEFLLARIVSNPFGPTPVLVETGESLSPELKELRRLVISLSVAFAIAAGVALCGAAFLIRRALRPIEEITISAENITSRNLSERLPVPQTGDEFEHVSRALNQMIHRLDEAFQYNRRFLADASHELRTPLTVIHGELESLAQAPGLSPEAQERLGSVLEEVTRIMRIVEGLFALSRLDAGEAQSAAEPCNLSQVVCSTADQMSLLAEDKKIEVRCAAEKPVWVKGDRSRLKQVVVNLLDNAIKYTHYQGLISLRVFADAGKAIFEISDNGIGIPAESIPHVFERFFRVDKARSRDLGGAGLGLPIAKAICSAHGGNISVTSTVEKAGTTFRVELPLSDSPPNPIFV